MDPRFIFDTDNLNLYENDLITGDSFQKPRSSSTHVNQFKDSENPFC